MIFYKAQERAMSPNVVKEWPAVIPHPTDKNGRLAKASCFSDEELLAACCGDCKKNDCEILY